MHSHYLVHFVFTMLFTCTQSVIVITLITMVFFLQNARPPFESASVGSDGFDSLCLRKTSCFFEAVFGRAEHHCVCSVVVCISSDLLGPFLLFEEGDIYCPLHYLSFQFFKRQNLRVSRTSDSELL